MTKKNVFSTAIVMLFVGIITLVVVQKSHTETLLGEDISMLDFLKKYRHYKTLSVAAAVQSDKLNGWPYRHNQKL